MKFKFLLVSAVLFQVLVMSLSVAKAAMPIYQPYYDVESDHENWDGIMYLWETNVMRGYANHSFLPDQKINRAEFLKVVMFDHMNLASGGGCFGDVAEEWFAPFVCYAKGLGFVSGYADGNFRPEQSVTFVEAAKLMVNSYGLIVPKLETENWYDLYVAALEEKGAIPMSIERLGQEITRGEMAEMIWRVKAGVSELPSREVEELR